MTRVYRTAPALVTVILCTLLLWGCDVPGACYKETRFLTPVSHF